MMTTAEIASDFRDEAVLDNRLSAAEFQSVRALLVDMRPRDARGARRVVDRRGRLPDELAVLDNRAVGTVDLEPIRTAVLGVDQAIADRDVVGFDRDRATDPVEVLVDGPVLANRPGTGVRRERTDRTGVVRSRLRHADSTRVVG